MSTKQKGTIMKKAKTELTADAVKAAIKERKPASMTQLAHALGHRGNVSGTLTRKLRGLVPGIDGLLGKVARPAKVGKATKKANVAKLVDKMAKPTAKQTMVHSCGTKGAKYARDPRNPFREGSSYGTVFDILASYPNGIEKEMLVRLVATETGKTIVRAGYDCQVVLSARPNEDGLNNNDSPRNRSCRPGYWVKRENGHVQLMVD